MKRFEVKQGMNDAPLTRHPQTGEAIRRVILGGWGLVASKPVNGNSSPGGGCGPSGCC